MLFIKLEQSSNNNSAVIEKKPAELKNKFPKYKVLLHNDQHILNQIRVQILLSLALETLQNHYLEHA